jgi:hypothetical protein
MTAGILNQEDAFELQMVQQDLLSDTLFLIGTLISINQNKEAEQKIINPGENQPSGMNAVSSDNVPFGLGPITLVLFLAGTAILAYTGTERLNKQKAEAGSNPDQTTVNNIRGGEIVIWGQLVRIIGYIISITGERIRNANPV